MMELFGRIADKTRDILYLNPGIYIEGNKEMMIENCRRIEEYNEVFMRLIGGGLCIQIWGSGLRAYDFKTKGLIIRGKITQIEFIERNSRDNAQSDTRKREDKCSGQEPL